MSRSNVMWVEKYRPSKLSEIINQKETIASLKSLLKNQSEIPHLLFSGSAGVGKTTTALCLSREILGERFNDYVLELNASDERGINMVRERVKKFSRFAGLDTEIPFKIIILDEADEMTSDAQTALRRIIEDTAKYCRFILIANNISKIIAPIQSRCAVFKFTKIDEKEVTAYLKEVVTKEKVKADEKSLKSISEFSGGDLRQSINLLQAAASSGNVTEAKVKDIVGSSRSKDIEKILKLSLDGKISDARNQMIEMIKVYGVSESDFLKNLNQSVFNLKIKNLEGVLEIIAKYDYRILVGSNPEIQLSALLAEISKFGK